MNRVKNGVFLVRKWSYTTLNIVNIRKMWEKKGKIRRTRSMTKKRSSEILSLKMDIFSEIGPHKNFLVPPNSAPGLRPCILAYVYHILVHANHTMAFKVCSIRITLINHDATVVSHCTMH